MIKLKIAFAKARRAHDFLGVCVARGLTMGCCNP